MLVSLAFCPHPVLIVPATSQLAAESLAGLRQACDAAVGGMLDSRPDRVLVLGGGPRAESYRSGDWGSLRGYGVPVRAVLGAGACSGQARLPLSLTVGAWLMARSGYGGELQGFGIPSGASEDMLATWAQEVVDLAVGGAPGSGTERLGILVMGDGSARRDLAAPGYVDDRAVPFDDRVAGALAGGDAETLANLDPQEGAELMAAGTTAWRLVGRVCRRESRPWRARLLATEAPYGVAYHVAAWSVDEATDRGGGTSAAAPRERDQ